METRWKLLGPLLAGIAEFAAVVAVAVAVEAAATWVAAAVAAKGLEGLRSWLVGLLLAGAAVEVFG